MCRPRSSLSLDSEEETWNTPYLDIFALSIIQFLLSTLIFSYPVYLLVLLESQNYDLKTPLWTTITFVAASKVTNPWVKSYCKHLDNIKHNVHKRNISICVGVFFLDLVGAAFIKSANSQILLYGVIGGTLSSLIWGHLQYLVKDTSLHFPHLFAMLDQVTKAVSLIFVPHFVLFLTEYYGVFDSQFILSAVILNIIPLSLILKRVHNEKFGLSKFQTIERLSVEMSEIHRHTPLSPESSSSSEDEEDDDDLLEMIDKPTSPDPAANIQFYYQNVGVKILPNIPEENEVEEEDDINEINAKRLSKISAILQGLKAVRDVNNSVNNLYVPDTEPEAPTPEPDLFETNSDLDAQPRCFSISSRTRKNFKTKRRELEDFAEEYFIKSFPRTLGKIYFYPAVISSTITTLLGTIIWTVSPAIKFLENKKDLVQYSDEFVESNKDLTLDEPVFMLTIIGFSWIFFLVGSPVWSKLSSIKVKLFFLTGLSIIGFSLYILHRSSNDKFTLFALSFGLGHGIVSYTESMACENFFGKRNWKILLGPLEITSGFSVIVSYLAIYCFNCKISSLFPYAYWFYIFNVVLWIFAYVSKEAVIYFRRIRIKKHERYKDFGF